MPNVLRRSFVFTSIAAAGLAFTVLNAPALAQHSGTSADTYVCPHTGKLINKSTGYEVCQHTGKDICPVSGKLIDRSAKDMTDTHDEAPAAPQAHEPVLYAVQFHADWCGACRNIDQKRPQVEEALADQDVLFITLNFTDDQSKRQSEMLAAALGLDSVWFDNQKTGFVLLVTPEGEVVDRLTSKHKAGEMTSTIQDAVTAAKKMMMDKEATDEMATLTRSKEEERQRDDWINPGARA